MVVLIVAGGASRADEPLQVLPRIAAVAALAATIWPLQAPRQSIDRRSMWLMIGVYTLVVLQLIPLPPGVWGGLPGHEIYSQIAFEAGSVHWRPLTLTPDLTLNALVALLPATGAWLAYSYLDDPDRARLWMLVTAAAVGSSLLGMVQVIGGGDGFRLYFETTPAAAVGLLANRNHEAVFLAGAIPIIGALASAREGSDQRLGSAVVAFGAMMVLILGVALTGSRSGLLMGAIGLITGMIFLRRQLLLFPPTIWKRVMLIGGFALALALISAFALRSGVIERLSQTDPASETRAQIFRPLLHTAQAFMPLGSGFGSFSAVYRQFEPDALLSTIYLNEAHNEVLQFAIEGGVPALLLLASFLWWWVSALRRLIRSRSHRPMAIAAFVFTAILMAESLVDYPLRTPLLSALFAMACVEMARPPRAKSNG